MLIKEGRRRVGLTQAELAERLGTAQSVIARWESGSRSPSFKTVTRALKACGLSLDIALVASDDHDLSLATRWRQRAPAERLHLLLDLLRVEDWARQAKQMDV